MSDIPYNFFELVDQKMKYVVYGDTDSMYIHLPIKPKTTTKAIEESNKISTEINNIISNFNEKVILQKLGIKKEHNHLNFKTEIIADKFLLVDVKKKYAFKLIVEKGKELPKPKIEYVGIPIVRTDYAYLTKKFIRRIVEEAAMSTLDKKQIMQKLNDIAKEIMTEINECIETYKLEHIARPCKWSGGYKDDEPYQVIAMRFYNTIVGEKVFIPLTSGQYIPIKINNPAKFSTYVSSITNKNEYALQNTPLNKLNNLALPYNYDIVKVKNILQKLDITVDVNTIWTHVYNTDCQRIVSSIKQGC